MYKFKKGQKVKIIGNTCSHGQDIGSIQTLKSIYSGTSRPAWKMAGNDYYIVEEDIKPFGRGGKTKPTKFLLKYDLDTDPVEEYSTIKEIHERIDQLVKEESSLKKESIVVYKVEKVYPVTVETVTKITGLEGVK